MFPIGILLCRSSCAVSESFVIHAQDSPKFEWLTWECHPRGLYACHVTIRYSLLIHVMFRSCSPICLLSHSFLLSYFPLLYHSARSNDNSVVAATILAKTFVHDHKRTSRVLVDRRMLTFKETRELDFLPFWIETHSTPFTTRYMGTALYLCDSSFPGPYVMIWYILDEPF